MEPKTIARILAFGRVAIGAALVAAPARVAAGWVGEDSRRPGAQLALASVGARDVAIGLGTAWAVGEKDSARPWLLASAGSDLVDLAATLRHRELVGTGTLVGLVALISGSAATGLWLATELD